MAPSTKHPCPDCRHCQWCGEDRCRLCRVRSTGCRKKLTITEQIALYESLNRCDQGSTPCRFLLPRCDMQKG